MPDTSGDLPPLPPALAELLDPARLLHARCGRRIAEHPYGSIHLPCPFPELPPREFCPAEDPLPPVGTRSPNPLPASWAKRARAAARDLAAQWDWPAAVTRDVRQTIYAALAQDHGNLAGRLDRARRDGYDEAWRVVANLPADATAVDAARALTTAREASRG